MRFIILLLFVFLIGCTSSFESSLNSRDTLLKSGVKLCMITNIKFMDKPPTIDVELWDLCINDLFKPLGVK